MTRSTLPLVFVCCLLSTLAMPASAVDSKPTVPVDDYDRWEMLRRPRLAPSGEAASWEIERVDGERVLHLQRLGEPHGTSDGHWKIPWGTGAEFSDQGRFVFWRVTPSKEEREALQKEQKPVRDRGEWLDLETGVRRQLGEVSRLEFDATGEYLAVLGTPSDSSTANAANANAADGKSAVDLHILDLKTGGKVVFGAVESFVWHEEKPLLAMSVAGGGDRGYALQVWAPQTGRLLALDHVAASYEHLTWHESADALAVLRPVLDESPALEEGDNPSEGASEGASEEDASAEESKAGDSKESDSKESDSEDRDEYEIWLWRGLESLHPQAAPEALRSRGDGDVIFDPVETVFAPAAQRSPPEYYISADRALAWSPDGRRLSLGLLEREVPVVEELPVVEESTAEEAVPEESAEESTEEQRNDAETGSPGKPEEEKLPSVQIWHTSDVRIQPQQKVQAEQDEKRTLLAVWDLDSDQIVRVSSDLQKEALVLQSWTHAAETDETPYNWGTMFGRRFRDVWLVDLETGQRHKALEKTRHTWPSADGRYILGFDGEHYWTYEPASGQRVLITEGIDAQFADLDRDLPNDGIAPPFGVGGWLENDEAVLLYDQFDVWRVHPGGTADGIAAERLTRGAEETVVHRLWDLDDEEENFAEPLWFHLRHEWTEQRGIGRWTAEGGYERLRLEDHNLLDLQAAEGDPPQTLLLSRESRTAPPHLQVTDGDLQPMQELAQTNPFFADYAWTRAELVEYRNTEDRRLHGVLLYPAQHDPKTKYPMIVYGYEVMSPSMHQWEPPSEKDVYNFVTWTQRGYFVFLPDVHFRAGDPGVSLAETLRAAIDAVAAQGHIDPSKVGFVGHSWGGYSAAYLAARTNIFAATVAGAPLTDFVSFMGQIHTGPGIPEVDHWETGQARMAVPYWEDPDGHERNSPLHGVHEMTTPVLLMHGDSDQVVEFFQSSVFYNFARRAGKQLVLLVYEGEGHGLRREENRIDYHRRILEWFGHYLQGKPAPAWITEGVDWLAHEDEKRRVAVKSEVESEP